MMSDPASILIAAALLLALIGVYRLIRLKNGTIMPVEKKSSKRLYVVAGRGVRRLTVALVMAAMRGIALFRR